MSGLQSWAWNRDHRGQAECISTSASVSHQREHDECNKEKTADALYSKSSVKGLELQGGCLLP